MAGCRRARLLTRGRARCARSRSRRRATTSTSCGMTWRTMDRTSFRGRWRSTRRTACAPPGNSPAPTPVPSPGVPVSHRLAALRRALTDVEPHVDGMLVTEAENRRFLSGFTGSAGQLVLTGSAAVLLTDFRYVEQAGAQSPDFEVVKTEGHAWSAIAQQAERLDIRALGFESETLTVDQHLRLSESLRETAPRTTLVPLRGFVERLRQVKDAAELELIRAAVLIGDRALESVAAGLRPGVTEREVAWRLEVEMR